MENLAEPQEADTPNLTPANAVNNRQELRPLPLRVAHSQYVRLTEARDRTGISVQEHVRRAVDAYLDATERQAIELGLMPSRPKPKSRPLSNSQSSASAVPARRPAPTVVRK